MVATLALFAAALVAAASAAGNQYDAALKHFHHRHHHHRHPHRGLRGHHNHDMAMVHHFATPKLNWNPEGDEEAARKYLSPLITPKATREHPEMLSGRHPSVEKALDGMNGDLVDLKVKQEASAKSRTELEGKMNDVVHHMNDAMSIKHAIQAKEAQMRVESNKLNHLEHEAEHMDQTHKSLVSSLHRVLEPKLRIAEERLSRKELLLAKEEKAAKAWHEKQLELHEHAIEELHAKQATHESLLQAEKDVKAAQKLEESMRNKYDMQRQKVAQEVQSFRYAETRAKAERTHEEAAKKNAMAAQESVKKLNKVMTVESEKVEESVEVSKGRIHHRMEELQKKRDKVGGELAELKEKYHQWQENERQRAAEVVKKGQDTADAAEAYGEKQKAVLENAEKKVVHDAQVKNDWAWEQGKQEFSGFTDSNPSLED